MLYETSKPAILVIEDDKDIREATKDALENEGYEVVTAGHGLDGLNIIKNTRIKPKLILLDLNMPVMDGYEFLEEKSQDINFSDIPVIVFSADQNKAKIHSAVAHIKKPSDLDTILDLVKKYRRR